MRAVFVFLVLLLSAIGIAWATRKPARAKRFSCPQCGGTSWGSGQPFDTGTCYGCGFKWPRKNDAMYFHAP